MTRVELQLPAAARMFRAYSWQRPAARLLLGSVAQEVFQTATMDVLAVPSG